MAKQGSIKHYRQSGITVNPSALPYSEIAVAKDGTLFVGNDGNIPVKIGKAPITYIINITTTWTGSAAPYTQTVAVNGLLASDTPIVDVVLSTTAATAKLQLEAWAYVDKIVANTNSITVTCFEEKPTTIIPIQLKVVR